MSAPQRPAWLTEGGHDCPSWCNAIHGATDSYEDREHFSTVTPITLTADELTRDEDGGAMCRGAEGLPHINMHFVQHYREAQPRIWVGKGGSRHGFYLTTAEAEQLAQELTDLVTMARRRDEGGQQ